jgi:hypothetical protein
MKLRFNLLMVCVILLLAQSAQAAREHHVALVQKYIRISGLEDTINSLPDMLVALAEQNRLTSEHPEIDKMVTESMVKSFDSKKMFAELEQYFLAHTDEYYLVQILSWLETPLARKIVQEEKQSEQPANNAEMLRYLAKLQENPPAQERISLVQDLVATTRTAELAAEITLRITRGLLESVNMMLPADKQVPKEKIEAHLQQMQAMIQGALRQQMTLTAYYTYRNISNMELQKYIAFYKTKTGQKEIDTTGGALVHVMGNWFTEVGQQLLPSPPPTAEGQQPI